MRVHVANETLERRWNDKVPHRPETGCWEWAGYICKQTGYGRISNRPGPPITASVASWIIHNGTIPLGLVVRHKCDNRSCCRPDHLELGTQADNVADMVRRGRCNNARDSTTCPLGHPYNSTCHEGYRSCSVCTNLVARRTSWNRRKARGIKVGAVCESCWFLETRCRCDQIFGENR